MPLTDARLAPIEETIHGVLVRDPYRWLEDRGLPETEEWIRVQQLRCDAYFAKLRGLSTIQQRVRKCCDIEVVDQPAKLGNLYFYRLRAPGQEQGCIHLRDAATGMERLLIDPSAEGPFVSVGIYRISTDGGILAYERKEGGEDKSSIHVLDVRSGATLSWRTGKGYARGFAFSPEHRGFFYCHASANDRNHAVAFHSFDDPAGEYVVFRVAHSRGSRVTLIADSCHLGVIRIHEVGKELVADLWIAERRDPSNWREVFTSKRLPFNPILADGKLFVVRHGCSSHAEVVELTLDGRDLRTLARCEGETIRQCAVVAQNVYICSYRSFTVHFPRITAQR